MSNEIMHNSNAKYILLLVLTIFVYALLFWQIFILNDSKSEAYIDIEITHSGKSDKQIMLVAEKEDKSRETLVKAILLKGRNKEVIQFKKDPNNRVKLYLVTNNDMNLIFDNTEGGADFEER